jgi:hypothetical protein
MALAATLTGRRLSGVNDAPRKFSQIKLFQKAHKLESQLVREPGSASSCIHQLKGLILAQNERWRRGLGMQVER